ncbi:hypothetical protein ACHAWF_010798 [Thalassiosira exigua]
MAAAEGDDPPAGPTGPPGEVPKRRRVLAPDDDDDENDDADEAARARSANDNDGGGDDDDDDGGDDDDADDGDGQGDDDDDEAALRRRRRLDALSAERRRRRIQREVAELREASFPGDEFYAGEQMSEVPDPDILQDPAHDADPMDDFVVGDNDDDLGYDDDGSDGDYVDDVGDDAAAILVGAGRGRRGRRKKRRDDEEEEGEGEDLMGTFESDYRAMEGLDTYGTEGMDDREYDAIDVDARARAEDVLAARDRERRRDEGRGRRNDTFISGLQDEFDEDEDRRRARRGAIGRMARAGGTGADAEEEGEEYDSDEDSYMYAPPLNLEAFDVPVSEWIAHDKTRNEIMRRFRNFLKEFREGEQFNLDEPGLDEAERKRRKRLIKNTPPTYLEKIRHMCSSNRAALEVSYLHLVQREPTLALWIDEVPRETLDVLDEAATRQTMRLFPSYHAIRDEIKVRVSDVPIVDSLRDLRRSQLDGLVKVSGVITRRGGVSPQLKLAYYDCVRCRTTTGPVRIEDTAFRSSGPESRESDVSETNAPSMCPACDSEGPFRINTSRSKYRNYQRANLQERPGSVPPGRVPRTKEVIFLDDLVDIARPGEEVEITGIFCSTYDYSLTRRSGFPVFQTYVAANHVRKREDASSASNLSEADRREILELAADPHIGRRIVRSIAPSIYGHEHVKMALAMALFGAVPKNVDDKHRIRGDVNVLVLGDPGTAKSQMLKYAESTAPRAVYSTGKGASAVGLTANVHKDPLTKEWTLEGGALVLADRGVCLIDEFDKMNEQDRTSIHEAMEQQSISVSKAGIVTSLQARCSVIAAANPIGGRYDSACTLSENVELTDPILQRFDCLCVLQDVVDPVADERLASFVTESHMMSVPTSDVARGAAPAPERSRIESADDGSGPGDPGDRLIPQALLRKYIQYARANCRPALRGGTFDQEKIASLYVQLRRESMSSGGVPIAVRHIESIMRMSEAHAKMHLRDYVRDDDMDASIKMMLESFVTAQKFSVRRSLRRSFAKFLSSGEDRVHLLLHILQDMMRNEAMYQTIRRRRMGESDDPEALEVPLEEFESRARDRRIYDVADFCSGRAFEEAGYTLDGRRRVIVRNF